VISADRLTTGTRNQIELANLLIARDRALAELVGLVDPAGSMSTNARAEAIAARMRPFLDRAWPRIHSGCRSPRGPLEAALCDLAKANCPTSQRRIFDLLAEIS